ncbi:MAG: HD domain-containing protein [Chloroflexi bacterium]|nr:HD domain-containing protein [Chloroflexota bacterium]
MMTKATAVSPPTTLFSITATYLPDTDQQFVRRAYDLAAQIHAGFERIDESPYIDHATAVAHRLAAWYAPADVIAAGLLHDTLNPHYAANLSLEQIEKQLNGTVAKLVQDVTRLSQLGAPFSYDLASPIQDRMAFVTSQLPWAALILQRSPLAVVIKIADKLHNCESIATLKPERQTAFATGVMSVFVPFAERLGMRAVKRHLEDAAFAVLEPDIFARMQTLYPAQKRQAAATPLVTQLKEALLAQDVGAQVFTRPRSFYDMHRLDAETKGTVPLHLADPLIVVTAATPICYQALGIVHQLWPPKPGHLLDFIAAPKQNGYRALHTQSHYQADEWLTVAIRDQEMDVAADYGITAAWQGIPFNFHSTFPTWEEPPPGKIGVLTPDGDFKTLPEGATPVDFAYAIHLGLGHQCTGALVNGRQTSLDRPLETGDVIHILTSNVSVGPSPEWLNYVKTKRARAAIRRWLKAEKPDDAAENGWLRLDEQLRLAGMTLSASPVMNRLTAVAAQLGYPSSDDLFLALGLNQVETQKVVDVLQEMEAKGDGRPALQATILSLSEAGMPQRLAACCRPAPPDPIVGYLTKAGVVTIHRADCAHVRRLRPHIQAKWGQLDVQPKSEVQMVGLDRSGLVRDVSQVVTVAGVNMTSFHADRMSDGSARIIIGLGDLPLWQLDHLEALLGKLPDVRQITRSRPTMSTQMSYDSVLARHFENPYTLRPVSGIGFFGRKRELLELINNLRDVRPGEAVLLWGPRRIGKTSLLLEFQQRVMASQDYVLVFVDMQRLSGRSTTMFIRDILRAIAKALNNSVRTPRLSHLRRDPLGYFRGFLENVPALQNKHLVLIIDEFQLISNLQEEEVSLADMNRAFRSLIQHRGGLSIIFSGGGVLDTLLRQPDTSFMLEVARYQKVDCLDEADARDLITKPVQRAVYDTAVVERLLQLTARHPYYLQWLCGELVARADRVEDKMIQDEHLDTLLAEWLPEQGEQFFNHMWGSSTGFSYAQQYLSKLALVAMSTATPASEWWTTADFTALLGTHLPQEPGLWSTLHDLAQMDTLLTNRINTQYAVRMPLFQLWIQANYTVERVVERRNTECGIRMTDDGQRCNDDNIFKL